MCVCLLELGKGILLPSQREREVIKIEHKFWVIKKFNMIFIIVINIQTYSLYVLWEVGNKFLINL